MGRFSPAFTPQPRGNPIADALVSIEEIKRQRRLDEEAKQENARRAEHDDLAYALAGIFKGAAPDEGDRNVYAPQMQTQGNEVAKALGGGGLGIGGPNPVKGGIFDRPVGLGATPGFNGNLPHPLAGTSLEGASLAPAPKPYAFDPTTGQFNKGPQAQQPQALGQIAPRYQQLTPGHYRDRNATPEQHQIDQQYAQREAAKQEAQARFDRLAQALGGAAIPSDVAPLLAEDPKLLESVGGKLIEKRLGLGSLTDKNIDPLSPEGIKARRELAAYESSLQQGREAQKAAHTPPRKVSASVLTGISKNESAVQRIDEAIAAIKAHPTAVGLRRLGVPEGVAQRTDPEGVDARAKLARIAAIEIHTQAGSNQTARELVNLRPYIPDMTNSSEAAVAKLENLKRAVQSETSILRKNAGLDEVDAPSGGTGNIDLSKPGHAGVSDDELRRAAADLERIRKAQGKP